MADTPDVPALVRTPAAQVAEPTPMRRGSLSERYVKCRKPGPRKRQPKRGLSADGVEGWDFEAIESAASHDTDEGSSTSSTSSGTSATSARRSTNQGPFPPHQFCCLVGLTGTVDPSQHWGSRVAPCSLSR